MFDMTVKEEEALLNELSRRTYSYPYPDDSCTIAGDTVLQCPKCHDGEIETRCVVERYEGEIRSWSFTHRCNNCGAKFELAPLRADVRLRSPLDEVRSLETPFGTFHALVNGSEVPLRHRAVTHDIGGAYGKAPFHEMDVDISGCAVGDVVRCRFEDVYLEFISSDERVDYGCAVNGGYAMVVSGFNPEFDLYRGESYGRELERLYPYDQKGMTLEGFDYIIERDPRAYDVAAFYWSRFIPIGAVWVPKPCESFTFFDEAGFELDNRLEERLSYPA
ncbi:MAG: hypothetical protein ACOX4F_04220 [Atopobiaceae bacterium]|jgi:hypothetical protein